MARAVPRELPRRRPRRPHDRYFLDHVAQWICEVDRGKLHRTRATTPPTWRRPSASRSRARRTRSCRSASRRARLGPLRRQGPPDQEQGPPRPVRGDGRGGREAPQAGLRGDPDPDAAAPGNVVVEVDHLDKVFENRVLIKDLSFTLPRNGIVGVIGPNGVGKTTLFKTIVGLEQPDSGTVKVGDTVKLSYVDQSRANIAPRRRCGRSSPTGSTSSRSVRTRCPRARTSPRSGSRDRTSRSGRRCSPVVSVTV